MKIEVRHRCTDFNGYRSARVKSLFNCESGAEFNLDADLPIENFPWSVGLVVGPSGSGKSSIGHRILGERAYRIGQWDRWPKDAPVIEAISPKGDFDAVAAALSAVGLGSVPSWLRPYSVLSMGERFRAGLARIICEAPSAVVIDEFTSVVDRQIARVGAAAFVKAWRRHAAASAESPRRCVLLSCHRDIVDWVQPDWTFDTQTGVFARGCLQRRPPIDLVIEQTDWRFWPLFEPHHYLKLPRMIAAKCYVGFVDGQPVAHIAVGGKNYTTPGGGHAVEARACRLVIMPEWQGIGVGMRFLNEVCRLQGEGLGALKGRPVTTLFHTSHPGLAAALRRDPKWTQVSAALMGNCKARSAESLSRSRARQGMTACGSGFGGHFRAVQGFRYYGEEAAP